MFVTYTTFPNRNESVVYHLGRKVQKRHCYYLTQFGRQTAVLALKLREMVIIPHLAFNL
jgi:hypothetical protein